MLDTMKALASSRKFWVGTITVLAIAGAVLLVALGKLDAAQLTATIAGITAVGITVIGSIAWEDTAEKKAKSQDYAKVPTKKKEPAS